MECTALHAIKNEQDRTLDNLIKEDPNLINWKDNTGLSLLHRAALFGSYNCSQVLLHRGADPYCSLQNHSEWTPMHLAARNSSFNIIKAYIDYNINLNAIDGLGLCANISIPEP